MAQTKRTSEIRLTLYSSANALNTKTYIIVLLFHKYQFHGTVLLDHLLTT